MKKRGFTLIEILVALAIFTGSIMFLYKSNGTATKLRNKSIRNESLLSLTESITYVMKDIDYDKYDKLNTLTTLDFQKSSPIVAEIKPVLDEMDLHELNKDDIKIEIKKIKVVAEYFNGEISQNIRGKTVKENEVYKTPDKLGYGNTNKNLAYEHSKLPNSNKPNEINPFKTVPDDILKLEVTIYNKNQINSKISRILYIFK